MAFSPKDLELTTEEKAAAKRHEDAIDIELKNSFVEGRNNIRIHVRDSAYNLPILTDRIKREVARRYTNAGWKEAAFDIQDNWGNYWKFKMQ